MFYLSLMKYSVIFLLFFTLFIPSFSSHAKPEKWVDGEKSFSLFHEKSRGMDISESQQLYKELIESLAPVFYDEAVYYKNILKANWEKKRLKSLKSNFEFYQKTPIETFQNAYKVMRNSVKKGLGNFKAFYPLYDPNITIMLVPGITWGGSYTNASDGEYMAVGVDLLVMRPDLMKIDRLDFLIVHELSHDYHQQFQGKPRTGKEMKDNFTFADRMWQEGVANWLAWQTNRDYDYGNIAQKKIKLDQCVLIELAPRFVNVSQTLIFSKEAGPLINDWFSSSSTMRLKNEKTIPPMVGYLMGAFVFDELVKNGRNIEELLRLKATEARKPLIDTLTQISKRGDCSKSLL